MTDAAVPAVQVEEVSWEGAGPELTAIRFEVFVHEQGFAADIELDGLDPQCAHVVARSAGGAPIGTARLAPDGHLGRVAVQREHRRRGVGARLMQCLVEVARRRGLPRVELHAQLHAVPFYERLGFRCEGAVFDEAGAPHQKLVLDLDAG
ncbi:MAG: GNAT family N-acetyltransferase [Proteobacteria bacterium]|nr:GNAT family N-acetyltransferase [Pseudomonadota bacterium]